MGFKSTAAPRTTVSVQGGTGTGPLPDLTINKTGPTSVAPGTGRPYGPDFPAITTADQVSDISKAPEATRFATAVAGYGSLLRGGRGAKMSLHHNLWAHHAARMPRPGNYLVPDRDPRALARRVLELLETD